MRALFDWLKPATPPPQSNWSAAPETNRGDMPSRIGSYAIERKLGQGGMGVVYRARDERLKRAVALKMMSSLGNDAQARARFWREAQVAASVNHPNVCQIYEISEDHGELFIAMELLEGEALSDRLLKGPLSIANAMPIELGILSALSALHSRGIVHRDLKPSNVFLTPHNVKLIDFGLARPTPEPSHASTGLSQTGMLWGTPSYMAPEQVTSGTADSRSDLFAAGAILFELLAGRRAFAGRTVVDIVHATLHEQPPALTGTSAVTAVDRVIRRALAKRPEERPASADVMASELRAIREVEDDTTAVLARPLTRLVVLPFRILRSDPETDFLAFSLPDAIATSLSGIGSLIVRSSSTAARCAETPDLKALAAAADVDRVVTGTLLRSGDQLRAAVQLVAAPDGTLLTSHTVQSSLGDLFRLQDDIARRVVEALALPLTGEAASRPEVPQNAGAYELYLRANELARTFSGLARARDLYERCLQLDSSFAPAWAHLGRCHRLIGKFVDGTPDSEPRAQRAFERALELNPRLPVAHKFYANLEGDIGHAERALVRLLGEINHDRNDPELFAGLVHACRYCGLYDESMAAHAEARRLDPNVPTSLGQTLLLAGDLERLLTVEPPPPGTGADEWIQARVTAFGLAGRRDESRKGLAELRQVPRVSAFQAWGDFLMAWLDRRSDDMLAAISTVNSLTLHNDPEFVFRVGWLLCDVGEHEQGLQYLQRALTKAYFPAPTLSASRSFDPLRSDSRFQTILAEAEAGRLHALAAFREAGGERLLGR